MNSNSLIERREQAMGPAYELFYQNPVHLVRGKGVWLFDADGRQYLDCYNNVASVGHCHPYVVEALAKQAATLNTHTRYLHENVVRYAERLGDSLPGELSVCMLVCTGTEANELAFRIARAVTGQDGAIVTEEAYHGNSIMVSELSTEDYPASERPAYLEAVEAPDPYRGRYQYGETDLGAKYASSLDVAIRDMTERGHPPAMFMCDNIFSSNGIQTPPPQYLQEAYRRVRAAGGLAVADEVQSGLCRLGDHTWGFADSAVIPDIVTMGKPLGDGHPLAAVVTTPEIVEKFTQKHHYFNTFGGNPVSAAVGLAVLDVIEQETILQNVHDVGLYLAEGLQSLSRQYDVIGDVRGKGLFYGVEMVSDRNRKSPAESDALNIREYLRDNGVLISTTGPNNNVLKIRPPMIFTRLNSDLLLGKLEQALKQL